MFDISKDWVPASPLLQAEQLLPLQEQWCWYSPGRVHHSAVTQCDDVLRPPQKHPELIFLTPTGLFELRSPLSADTALPHIPVKAPRVAPEGAHMQKCWPSLPAINPWTNHIANDTPDENKVCWLEPLAMRLQ